ncbi:metallophosphoesterase family protein [Kushneria phyllosphaerae]|uniref:3',5'-cyclic adenosine monophosphate phosphodiesterase CpdA n=1 Tax=Kushneria phyllosphaerae TaxID=2100822 RepID=A0A2R8CKS1_9GAMM|nr:metallophosphoesterase family protein [Kushneria phyllosphaerae]SPJ33500.1 3',5'-cyclic adenosine monophosphate phosphodiesterase CpdA [Kushneria phyllosphaerae]
MKVAAIADIHGNLMALEAVLADIKKQGVDLTVNLGDLLSGALQPRETAEYLMSLQLPTVRGNHERQLLDDTRPMGLSDSLARSAINDTQLQWLKALPASLNIEQEILLVHATPADDVTYWLETITAGGRRAATSEEAIARGGEPNVSLVLCGHTHIPRDLMLPNGTLIVNPGSVGLQAYDDEAPLPHVMETGSPHARYAILIRTGTAWRVEYRQVAYDWEGAARLALQNGRKDCVAALRHGRVVMPG